jgi:hypothetical protein
MHVSKKRRTDPRLKEDKRCVTAIPSSYFDDIYGLSLFLLKNGKLPYYHVQNYTEASH